MGNRSMVGLRPRGSDAIDGTSNGVDEEIPPEKVEEAELLQSLESTAQMVAAKTEMDDIKIGPPTGCRFIQLTCTDSGNTARSP